MGTEAEEPVRDASKSREADGVDSPDGDRFHVMAIVVAGIFSVFLILDLRGTFRCGTCNPVLRLQRADKRQPHAHHRRRRYQPATPLPRVPLHRANSNHRSRASSSTETTSRGDDRRGGADNAPEFLRVLVESTRRQAQELDDMAVNETTEEVRDDVALIVSRTDCPGRPRRRPRARIGDVDVRSARGDARPTTPPQINRLRQIQYRYADELPCRSRRLHRRTRPPAERRGHRASVLQDPLPPGGTGDAVPAPLLRGGSPRWSSS